MLDLPCVDIPPTAVTGLTISSQVPTWLADLPIAQEHDPSLKAFFTCACHGNQVFSVQHTSSGDLLLPEGKPIIPYDLRAVVLKEMREKRGHYDQAQIL